MPDGSTIRPPDTGTFRPDRQMSGLARRFESRPLTGTARSPAYRPVGLAELASLPFADAPDSAAAAAATAAAALADLAAGTGNGAQRPATAAPNVVQPVHAPPLSEDAPGRARRPAEPVRTDGAHPETPDITARTLDEARAAGRAEGLAAAQAELEAARNEATAAARALVRALARLAEPPAAAVDALAAALDVAVARLASQRAGQVIDAAPAAFARRIARLAARVAREQQAVAVHLHPDDLAAITPLLTAACPSDLAGLAAARLVADPSMARGDADLRAPGVRLADLCEDPGDEVPPA